MTLECPRNYVYSFLGLKGQRSSRSQGHDYAYVNVNVSVSRKNYIAQSHEASLHLHCVYSVVRRGFELYECLVWLMNC